MLLTISTEHKPATDLGYLLHKHPDRCQSFSLSFGSAHVFYPHVSNDRCEICLLLDVDPVGIVRGKGDWKDGLLDQYVNDRPFVASSLMSVAIAQVFSSALAGRSKERPELVATAMPLTARLDVLPVRGGPPLLHRLFEPLGYTVTCTGYTLDSRFADWGESPYYSVQLSIHTTIATLLQHLYVLIPVFDGKKHYYIGDEEVEKLLSKGESWLAEHPERDLIAHRYLLRRHNLVRTALERLTVDSLDRPVDDDGNGTPQADRDTVEDASQETLHDQRLTAVCEVLRLAGARRVVDLGCGEGKLLRRLLAQKEFTEIVGLDVSVRSLEIAHRRLRLDRLPERQRDRVRLLHGSLTYRDSRWHDFDAAAIVEVIEHLDPPRLHAFERVVFEHARPRLVVLTTPNREYNVLFPTLAADTLRHGDHRFEWTRAEFHTWADRVAAQFGYTVRYEAIGTDDPHVGPPSQMAIFMLRANISSNENDISREGVKHEESCA